MSLATDTRGTILQAAARLLATRPEAVQMRDIAEAASVGRATLYRYFATRDDLVRALARAATDELRSAVSGAHLDEVPAREGIERLVRICVQHMYAHGYLLFERAAAPDPQHVESSATHATLRALFERAQTEQLLRDDVPLDWLMASLFGICATAVRSQVSNPSELDHAAWLATTLYLQGAATRGAGPEHLT